MPIIFFTPGIKRAETNGEIQTDKVNLHPILRKYVNEIIDFIDKKESLTGGRLEFLVTEFRIAQMLVESTLKQITEAAIANSLKLTRYVLHNLLLKAGCKSTVDLVLEIKTQLNHT